MKRILVMLLCVSIMFTFLAACGSTSDNKGGVSGKKTEVKISCWGIETDPNSVNIKDAVELFNKKNNMNAVATVVLQSRSSTRQRSLQKWRQMKFLMCSTHGRQAS